MADAPFVHLHCHTHYSLLDGASRIPELVARTKALGMNSVAITDHGNLYGAIEFYRECKDAGINPIIGYEAYIASGSMKDKDARRRGEAAHHLTLLAQNATGFKNLVKMSSIAFLEGYHYVPRIDKELLAAHSEGIICLSGCASSEFSDFILREQMDEANALAEWFQKNFGENFYIEIQNNGLDIQKRCAEGAIEIANRIGAPLVATCDAHYLTQEDAPAHDVLLCINTGKTIKDDNRMRYGSDLFYVRQPQEMYDLFPNHHAAVKRSQEIANKVDIKLDFKARHFPVFTPPADKTAEQYLRDLCEIGLNERYGRSAGGSPAQQEVQASRLHYAKERLEHELGIICRMGFASYFLIVWDFVRFAISKGIPASARGSACGAVVSYVLKLSHVDPLEFDLLFERFLDPNRSEAPDIDIDFCQERREDVIAYVREKYGEESVAQIVTFGTLAAKAAIRDVGRVLDIPLERVNRLSNMVPKVLNISLEEALKQSSELRNEYDNEPDVKQMIDIAQKLEGTNRQAGTHAAGVVISNGPLTNYVPLHRVLRKGYENGNRQAEPIVTTQWVMGDLEKVGMLKMDFLGLRTLTVMDNAVKLIEKTQNKKVDLDNIPWEDKETFSLLQRGEARGVFQLESEGIRELLKRMKPDNIRDLIACNALYRPGPLGGGMVDAYVNRKHGREKPVYNHTIMEDILGETYGVMCYQEQVMRILNRLGGIELSSAYACIKAISKKKHDIIDQRRAEFIKGAQERGVSEEQAKEIFDLITFFGGYGFNKSHSAAYARIGYQTAYLKAHYPAEFMAALLSSEIEDSNKRDIMVEHIDDARRMGVEVLPPDVQRGDVEFTVHLGNIVFGLTAVKGLGRAAAAEIVRARKEKGPFKDFFDFCERLDLKVVPRAAIEKLIAAGAFDSMGGGHRAQLMDALPRAISSAGSVQEDRRHGQASLFDVMEEAGIAAVPITETLKEVPEWSPTERLKFEKEALGFYISSHPLARHEEDLNRFSSHRLSALSDVPSKQEVFIGGMLTQIRFMSTKKARNGNSRYVRCRIADMSNAIECVMWPEDFERYKSFFEEDRVCFVSGIVERIREEPSLQLTRVVDLEQGKRERTTGLMLAFNLATHGPKDVDAVARVLRRAPGSVPVFLCVHDAAGKKLTMRSSQDYRIDPNKLSTAELEVVLGEGKVQFSRPGSSNGK